MSQTMPSFSAETTRVGDAHVLRLIGELDLATIEDLRVEFHRLTDQGVTALVIDARELQFIDSRGLQTLIDSAQQVLAHGSVALVPSRSVRRILQITALIEVLPTVESFEQALSAVSASVPPTDLHLS